MVGLGPAAAGPFHRAYGHSQGRRAKQPEAPAGLFQRGEHGPHGPGPGRGAGGTGQRQCLDRRPGLRRRAAAHVQPRGLQGPAVSLRGRSAARHGHGAHAPVGRSATAAAVAGGLFCRRRGRHCLPAAPERLYGRISSGPGPVGRPHPVGRGTPDGPAAGPGRTGGHQRPGGGPLRQGLRHHLSRRAAFALCGHGPPVFLADALAPGPARRALPRRRTGRTVAV